MGLQLAPRKPLPDLTVQGNQWQPRASISVPNYGPQPTNNWNAPPPRPSGIIQARNLAVGALRGIPRGIGELEASLGFIKPGSVPHPGLGRTLLGSEPIQTSTQAAKDFTKRTTHKNLPTWAAVPIGVALSAPIGPGKGKVALKKAAEGAPLPRPKVSAKNPPTPVTVQAAGQGAKVRGFKKNTFKSNFYKGDPVLKQVIDSIPGYKPISNPKTYGRAAGEISKNYSASYARIATKPQLTSAHDVATANILLRDTIERGDLEASIQLGKKLGIDGTKLGQAVQAYAGWKKTTPEGILRFAVKKAGSAGREVDTATAERLTGRAKEIAAMPEGFDKAKATRGLLDEAEGLGHNWRNVTQEILSTPRAAMATADLSAPLRQGAVLGARFPKEFKQSFTESVKFFGQPKTFERSMFEISQRPTYPLMKQHKLAVNGATDLTGTEELFMKNLLESGPAKKVGVGHVVAASNRAYSGFLTKFRADVFDRVIKDSEAAGVKLDKNALDSMARFINTASGRGGLGGLEKSAGALSQALFSPRLWASRLALLNPVYYARLKGPARKYALQTSGAFAGVAATVLGLAAAAGAVVEMDPRSADFAKIKVGNTRYDILGGLQQHLRVAWQMKTGEKINTVTGAMQTLGPDRGYGKPSRLDLLQQFVENKENPVVAFGSKALRGTDQVGNKVNLATEAGKLLVPLNIQQGYETAKDVGSATKGGALTAPGIFGVGVQTYGLQATKDKGKPLTEKQAGTLTKAEQDALKQGRTPKTGKSLGDGLFKLSDGKIYGKVGDKFKTFDTPEAAKLGLAKDKFKKSGKTSEVFGDKVLRRNADGSVRATSKLTYDYSLDLNKLQAAKKQGNFDAWFEIADRQLGNLQKQLKDSSLDDLEKSNIQEKIDNLLAEGKKYQGYGGFTKGSSSSRSARTSSGGARVASNGSAYKYAISLSKGSISSPKVSVRKGGIKSKKLALSKPKVTIKKSKV